MWMITCTYFDMLQKRRSARCNANLRRRLKEVWGTSLNRSLVCPLDWPSGQAESCRLPVGATCTPPNAVRCK
jgi:hypothetical protein